jgi:hypothetical protein
VRSAPTIISQSTPCGRGAGAFAAPAGRQAGLGETVEAAEEGEAEAVVEHVPFPDQLAVLPDLLDIAFHRARKERVGEPLAGDGQGGVPRGGEDRVAAPRGVSAGETHARSLARFGDDGGVGEGLAEDRHLLAGPAVVADRSRQSGAVMGSRADGGEGDGRLR